MDASTGKFVNHRPLTAGPSGYQRWRKIKDHAATWSITGGGSGVLLTILLIFFYLLYEIMPLFQSAELEQRASYALPGAAGHATLHLAMEEQAEVGMRLDNSGEVQFFAVDNGAAIASHRLPLSADITSFAIDNEQNRVFALGAADGTVLVAQHNYRSSYPDGQRVITPRVDVLYSDNTALAQTPLKRLAVRDTETDLMVIAVANRQLVGRHWTKEEDFLTEEVTLEEQTLTLPALDIDAQKLLIGPTLNWLYVLGGNGEFRVIDLRSSEIIDSGYLFQGAKLTAARFLLGGISLLVANDRGDTSQWFMVREEGGHSQLQAIRHFKGEGAAIRGLATEHRRKGFVAVDDAQNLSIYYTTSHRRVASESLPVASVLGLAISPRADALLLQTGDGQLQHWEVHNEHPEVSWSALWEKVWYESYPEPDYIWQSSASNNDFEPKYSFSPLAFGTLKAAFYAMIIAAPLAICGAIYTAYFMAPGLRRKVKPLIELMEALPTVILGFLAGLWLAPFVEKHLPAVFSIFLVLPVGVLLFAWLWQLLPISLRKHVPEGWHPLLLTPVIILLVGGCVSLSAPMELWLFDGDMRAWLTHDLGISFDQRNSLVVGIAMGFAVIPTIFSIAEDAIFSVPKHLSYGSLALGATPWQTLVGVVMPTASPGIFSALMIGMGRAVGETMIVLMATGNTPIMDLNIFEGMRTLAANIAVEIGETEVDSSHYRVLFLAAFVLFLFTFVVNTVAEIIRQRLRSRYGNL